MMANTAIAELERRVRTVEEELNGQRHVNLFQVEQATRNSDVLHAVRNEAGAATTRLNHLAGDVAAIKAALAMHGRALDVLMQDVRQLRNGQDELNARLDRMEARLDRMQEEAAARHGEVLAAIRAVTGSAAPRHNSP